MLLQQVPEAGVIPIEQSIYANRYGWIGIGI